MKIYSNLFLIVLVGLVIGCATQNIEEPMTPAKIEKEIYKISGKEWGKGKKMIVTSELLLHLSDNVTDSLKSHIEIMRQLNIEYLVTTNLAKNRIFIDTDSGDGLVTSYDDETDWSLDGDGINDVSKWNHIAMTIPMVLPNLEGD